MGQQQLLLIVLGVIIVGIAVVVGINLFNAQAISANREAVISDLNNLGAMAMQYYKKPVSMAGGGNTYTNWTIPTQLQSTANGSYDLTTLTPQSITITGTGNELNGADSVKAHIDVTPTTIIATVDN